MTIKNGSITTVKLKNSTRFNAQKQYNGSRYSQRFDTIADAQEWLDDLNYLGATDANGNLTRKAKSAQLIIDEIDAKRAKNNTPTLQACINLFSKESETPSTSKYVKQLVLFTSILNEPVNEITRLMFEMELDRIQDEKNLSDSTRNRYQAAFSSLYKWLSRHKDFKQYSLINPTIGAPRGKESRGRMLFLDKEQQIALLESCRLSKWQGLYVLVYMLLITGSRRNEIAQLRWENVDLKEGVITLVKTKNGTDHAIKMPHGAIVMLKEWRMSQPVSNWVFQHPTNPRRAFINFDHYWKEAKERAKMPSDLRIHDLRHTVASTMLADGFSLEDIRATLNHKSLLMTNRYAHRLNIKDTVSKRDTGFLSLSVGGV